MPPYNPFNPYFSHNYYRPYNINHHNLNHKAKLPPSSNTANEKNQNNEKPLFTILGINLYLDDLLLLLILIFLYEEGVKDEYLFIALILLLLS